MSEKKLRSLATSIRRLANLRLEDAFSALGVQDVKTRLERLDLQWENFNKEHDETLCSEAIELMELEGVMVEVEEQFFAAKAAFKSKLEELEPLRQEHPISLQLNMPLQQSDLKNSWGEFDGNITKWQGFHDRFVAAVHENEQISPAFKFAYLRKSLMHNAARTLGEWQLTDNNYQEAWKRLNQLYDRKYQVCREHLRQFERLPVLSGPPTANDLQRMSNVTHESMRQLKAQGLPTEHWDMIIVHMLHDRLDQETAKQWELQRKSETPKADDMLEFLDKQAAALETGGRRPMRSLDQAKNVHEQGRAKSSGTTNSFRSTRSAPERKPLHCDVCGGCHQVYKCPEFLALSLRARADWVERRRLCINCFKRGHGVADCYTGPCERCPGFVKHNSVLCPKTSVNTVTRQDVDGDLRKTKRRAAESGVKKEWLAESSSAKRARLEKRGRGRELVQAVREKGEMEILEEELEILNKKEQILDKKGKILFKSNNIVKSNNVEEVNFNKIEPTSLTGLKPYLKCCSLYEDEVNVMLLPTALVYIEVQGEKFGPIRALVDSGAQPNLLSAEVQRKYRLPVLPNRRCIVAVSGSTVNIRHRIIAKIFPWYDSKSFVSAEFLVLPKENDWRPIIPTTDISIDQRANPSVIPWADPQYWRASEVDMLLGVGIVANIINAVVAKDTRGAIFLDSSLGILVFGAHERRIESVECMTVSSASCIDNSNLDQLLQRLWQLDQVGESNIKRTTEEETVEKFFVNTFSRDEQGRFIVKIPMRAEIKFIGNSRARALSRFMHLENRLEKDPILREKYVEFMRVYEELGHMKLATRPPGKNGQVYYIPHHCVTKKFRVVFDASCKTDLGISLNQVQLLGEKLQRDLHC